MASSVENNESNHSVPLLKTHAKAINVAVETITDYLDALGLPQPSFDPRAPNVTLPSNAPLSVLEARQQLIASSYAIQKLASEPAEYLPNLAIHYQVISCLSWLVEFDIFSAVPLDGSISYDDLARTVKVPEGQLKSVARMAIISNLLSEPVHGHLCHNAVSSLFVTQPEFLDWAKFLTRFSAPTAAAFAGATMKWSETVAKNETAFNIALDTSQPFFDYFSQSPDLAAIFSSYMKSVQRSYGTNLKHLVTGFDWESLGYATIIDVGGSTCSSSIALATAFPKLKIVVQDLPNTINNTFDILKNQPESIRSRISVEPYDFFTTQPRKGAEVYLLRMILHDWPSNTALTILRNQLEAIKANKNSRLIIMDTVLPTSGSSDSIVEEALLRVRDLTMMQVFNSKERDMVDFTDLFSRASDEYGNLSLVESIKPHGSVMSVMEVKYQPHE